MSRETISRRQLLTLGAVLTASTALGAASPCCRMSILFSFIALDLMPIC